MSFIAPLFFVALAALAIPVLIHLIQREKKQIMRFPSLMFVQRVPYKSIQRRRVHNWLLLLVRLAVLTLIVLAFARPFFERQDLGTATGGGAREVVILLDQSYSIGYGDRWERAQAAASEAINGLGPADRGSVVLFSSGAEIALRSTAEGERERLIAAVEAAEPTASATRFSPALKVAGGILADSQLPRREVILVSDFQRGGWRGEEGASLPDGATLTRRCRLPGGPSRQTWLSPPSRSSVPRSRIRSGWRSPRSWPTVAPSRSQVDSSASKSTGDPSRRNASTWKLAARPRSRLRRSRLPRAPCGGACEPALTRSPRG